MNWRMSRKLAPQHQIMCLKSIPIGTKLGKTRERSCTQQWQMLCFIQKSKTRIAALPQCQSAHRRRWLDGTTENVEAFWRHCWGGANIQSRWRRCFVDKALLWIPTWRITLSHTGNIQTSGIGAANTISNKQKLNTEISMKMDAVAADDSVPLELWTWIF